MKKRFKGKTAIVTGGGGGIGRALALELGSADASVVITDLRGERVERVVEELEQKGAKAGGFVVDHSKNSEACRFAESFFNDWGHVDILCLNAGVGHGGNIEDITIEDWEWVFSINVWGAVYMLRLFVPRMIERGSGSILITASGAGLIGIPGMAPYCASKFAMVGLAESLRGELKAHNINVSALCPGIIDTNVICDGRVDVVGKDGERAENKVEEFFKKFGADPAVVARDGIKAITHNIGIMPSPSHMWPPWLLKRFAPGLYQSMIRLVWEKGWLV